MEHHPRWNFYDTAYGLIGLLVCAYVWGTQPHDAALAISSVVVLAYAAGRTAGAHR